MSFPPRTRQRLVGLDVGERRVGVAVSDELGMIASPLESFDLKRGGIDGLVKLIESLDPAMIVVGLPTTMSGREGTQAAAVRAMARAIGEKSGRTIKYWDERLTSALAERSLIESRMRREKRKERLDAVAAALILQSYLDSRPS